MNFLLRKLLRQSARIITRQTDERVKFALNEITELRQIVRFILTESSHYRGFQQQTLESFDYQWRQLPEGKSLRGNAAFENEAMNLLEQYTGLSSDWFKGKKVLDAGSGNGRWSLVLCRAGADVTAVDYSDHGVNATTEACSKFPMFRAYQHDLLEKLDLPNTFDLVWSFGVLHHTGDTWKALHNIASCVKSEGFLFLMLYGQPRWENVGDFSDVNSYIEMRRTLAPMSFENRVTYLSSIKDNSDVHGWFDAASPSINDLYRFDEIAVRLKNLGFVNTRQTVDMRNLYIVSQKAKDY